MRDGAFQKWLARSYPDPVVATRMANVRRVERTLGDVDAAYARDELTFLISRLEYSRADEQVDAPYVSGIAIDGNVRNGLATLKAALKLYRRFRGQSETERR